MLKNGMGYAHQRLHLYIIETVSDPEWYFHQLLILYHPWRSENELVSGGHYETNFTLVYLDVEENIKQFEPCLNEVEETLARCGDSDDMGEVWDWLGKSLTSREHAKNTKHK